MYYVENVAALLIKKNVLLISQLVGHNTDMTHMLTYASTFTCICLQKHTHTSTHDALRTSKCTKILENCLLLRGWGRPWRTEWDSYGTQYRHDTHAYMCVCVYMHISANTHTHTWFFAHLKMHENVGEVSALERVRTPVKDRVRLVQHQIAWLHGDVVGKTIVANNLPYICIHGYVCVYVYSTRSPGSIVML